jgi:hypothetical protein
MVDIVDLAVDFMILVLSAVIGFALYYGVNTTLWDATVRTLWGLLPVAFIGIGVLALIIKVKYIKG